MKLFLQGLLQVPLFQSQHKSGLNKVDDPAQCSLSTNLQHQAPLASSSYQGTLKPILNEDTEAFITKMLKDWKSPGGVGIAVVRKDEEENWFVETKGYGNANAQGDRVDEDTLFGIGSNSKLFNAIAAGLLIHNTTLHDTQHFGFDLDGNPKPLNWDTRLKDVIPGFGLSDRVASERVTILDALSHRSGLPRHDASPVIGDELPDTIEKVKYLKFSRPFRDLWQYNNLMYEICSYLPTAILPSKISYARYVKENIFEPLGLSSTTFSYEVAQNSGKLADGFGRDTQVKDNQNGQDFTGRAIPYWNQESTEDGNVNAGDGGVISSAKDMATWLQTLLLLGKNPATNESIIPSEVVEKVAKGVMVMRPKAEWPEMSPTVYGMGQERGSYRAHEWVEHTGGVPGFATVIARFPRDNIGISVLSNDGELGGPIIRTLQYHLYDVALGLEPANWRQRYKDAQKKKDEASKAWDSPFELADTPSSRITGKKSHDCTNRKSDIWAFEGVYTSPGYGKKDLCVIHPSPAAETSATSGPCQTIRETVRDVLPGLKEKAEREDVPTLVAKWDNPFLGWIVFRDLGADGKLNISGATSFPTGDTERPYWIWEDVEVVDKDGTVEVEYTTGPEGSVKRLGFRGIWGPGSGVESPEDEPEVWFDRA